MTIEFPCPQTTRVVLLGASDYREGLRSSPAFAQVATDWQRYFLDAHGYGLAKGHLKSFFDLDLSSDDMLEQIAEWIRAEVNENQKTTAPVRDLFVCYVGHGLFDDTNLYCLATRRTREESIGSSSIRLKDLAVNISRIAETLRVYLILDACFSGAAATAFMSGASQALGQELRTAKFPEAGVSLLGSSSHDVVSHLIPERNTTLFSEAALAALRTGNRNRPGRGLSLREVKELANRFIASSPGAKVLSVTHSPRQAGGDLASIPLFPNWAVVEDPAGAAGHSGDPDAVAPDVEQQESAAIQYTEAQRQQVVLERNEAEVVTGRLLNWHLISFWLSDRIEATTKEIAAAKEERQEVVDQLKGIARRNGLWSALRGNHHRKVRSIDDRIALTQMAALKDQINKITWHFCTLTVTVQIMRTIQEAKSHDVAAKWLSDNRKTFRDYVEFCLESERGKAEMRVKTAAKAWRTLAYRRGMLFVAAALIAASTLLLFAVDYCWWTVTQNGAVASATETSVTSLLHSWEAIALLSSAGIGALLLSSLSLYTYVKEGNSEESNELSFSIITGLPGLVFLGLGCFILRYVAFETSGVQLDGFRGFAAGRLIVWAGFLAAIVASLWVYWFARAIGPQTWSWFREYRSAGSPEMCLAARRLAEFREP
jgi:hypothetical protein